MHSWDFNQTTYQKPSKVTCHTLQEATDMYASSTACIGLMTTAKEVAKCKKPDVYHFDHQWEICNTLSQSQTVRINNNLHTHASQGDDTKKQITELLDTNIWMYCEASNSSQKLNYGICRYAVACN